MNQDNLKAPSEPPIEKDDSNVYNFKCEKGDTKYRSVVILRIHKTKQHKEVLEVHCQQCEFEAKYPSNIDRHMSRQQRNRRIRLSRSLRSWGHLRPLFSKFVLRTQIFFLVFLHLPTCVISLLNAKNMYLVCI